MPSRNYGTFGSNDAYKLLLLTTRTSMRFNTSPMETRLEPAPTMHLADSSIFAPIVNSKAIRYVLFTFLSRCMFCACEPGVNTTTVDLPVLPLITRRTALMARSHDWTLRTFPICYARDAIPPKHPRSRPDHLRSSQMVKPLWNNWIRTPANYPLTIDWRACVRYHICCLLSLWQTAIRWLR